jgi:hypothetical protein
MNVPSFFKKVIIRHFFDLMNESVSFT